MKTTRHSSIMKLTLGVMVCLLVAGQVAWADFIFGEPEPVPNVNGDASDSAPQISRNGLELYFSSTRDTGTESIWVSKRLTPSDPWSVPTPIDAPVDPNLEQVFPSLSTDGLELYYADGTNIANPESHGSSDIWVLTRASITDPWNAPENLGPVINTGKEENSPCISADGLELYFAFNPGNMQPPNSEILMSTRASKEDPWGEPVILNSNVNGMFFEYNPFLSTDGLSLFLSAGFSLQQVYVARRSTTAEDWAWWEFFSPVNGFGTTHSVSYSSEDSTIYYSQGSNVFAKDFEILQIKVAPVVDLNNDGAVDTFDAFELLGNWGPTENSLYDIAPMPFGDGVVNGEDLKVLAEQMLLFEQSVDANGL